MNLVKLITDCQAKLDGGHKGEWESSTYPDNKRFWYIHTRLNDGETVPICKATWGNECLNEVGQEKREDAHNILALHNGFRKQLEVAREMIENGWNICALEAIEMMLTPTADYLGVEYE